AAISCVLTSGTVLPRCVSVLSRRGYAQVSAQKSALRPIRSGLPHRYNEGGGTSYDLPVSIEGPPVAGRRPRYRTWIRSRRLAVFVALSGICLAGSALSVVSPWLLLFLVPLAFFGYITVMLALTVYR